MIEENYKSLFQKIKTDEKHKERTKENMQKELIKMNNKPVKNISPSKYKYIALAATVLFASVIAFNFMNKEKLTPPVAVETPTNTEATILYSSLNFMDPIKVDAPVALNENQGKIAPFTENLLGESSAVIKGTVINISFKEYKDSGETLPSRQTVIYEVKVDKIYYSNESFNVGDTIRVENDLYTYTSLENSLVQLSGNRQYMLALNNNDAVLSIVYPFAPQIEITKDGQYFFPDTWVTLINEKTKTVTMDVQEDLGYYGEMKLRDDPQFEDDFQKIVNTYCK